MGITKKCLRKLQPNAHKMGKVANVLENAFRQVKEFARIINGLEMQAEANEIESKVWRLATLDREARIRRFLKLNPDLQNNWDAAVRIENKSREEFQMFFTGDDAKSELIQKLLVSFNQAIDEACERWEQKKRDIFQTTLFGNEKIPSLCEMNKLKGCHQCPNRVPCTKPENDYLSMVPKTQRI